MVRLQLIDVSMAKLMQRKQVLRRDLSSLLWTHSTRPQQASPMVQVQELDAYPHGSFMGGKWKGVGRTELSATESHVC